MPAATIRQTIPPVSDSETDGATEQMTSRSVLDSLLESGLHEMNRAFRAATLGGVGGARHRVRPTDDGGGVDALARGFGDLTTELLLASVYSIGFMFVILGRSELFTEHTTLAVIPVLDRQASFKQLGRLWGLVYVGNLVGGLLFTLLVILLMPELGVVDPSPSRRSP